MEYYINHAHQHTSDEYSTISSATGSSNITMEEALFSHISSDSRSEITAYSSESLKIAVRAQSPGRSNPTPSDVGQYQIVDLEIPERTENIAALPKIIFDQHLSTATKSNYERYFCNMYTQALYYLSPKNKGYSPAHAFHFFETTAVQGNQVYADLNDRTRMLISFAQYRAGRMLYEAEYTEEDDTYGHHQQQGLIYLLDSKKNGNAHASYILGVYAQECGDLDRACQLYYEASKAGILDAKVSFGITVLHRHVRSFQIEDAISALIEASNKDHSFASLTLALYYDREQQFQTAMKYCQRVKMSPANPIYGFTKYVIGIIHLKAGNDDAAFQYIAESAEVAHEDGHGAWACLALRKLGVLFLLGVGTPKNPVNAFRWIKKASDRGDEAASIILGQMYTSGLGCPVDRVSAVSLFERHRNNVAAKLSLGLLMMKFNPEYAYQEFLSIINFKSTPYDEENWDMQSIKCEAAVRIAIWTFNGIGGVKRDPHEAVLLLKNLSDQRNYTGAHYWLAWAYLEGVKDQDGSMIVIKNPSKAFEYFLKGAKKNDVKCLYQVGRMVQSGIHEHPQYQKQDAFQFFLKAAQLNHVESQTQVGIYYFNGLAPVCHNLDKAFEYFSLAARHNNTEAILYLADYLVKNYTKNHNINVLQIYHELNRAAAAKNPIAYRMLALVVNSGVDLSVTYESILKKTGDQELWAIYQSSKQEAYNVEFRFALRCLWKALELGDHKSGQHLCKLFPKMPEDDVVKTIYVFIASEGPIPGKMSLALAQFLVVCGKKSLALKKYLEVADYQGLSTTAGWSACLEAAKLILVEKQGKARSKSLIFSYLQAMVKYNGKELFLPYFLLEISIRTKLIKSYYASYQDSKLEEQLNGLDALLNGLPSNKQMNESKAELLYYQGLLSLHNANVSNNREIARAYLSESKKLGHILACLELGYLYATMEDEEELADACFFEVEESRSTPINFQGRLAESMVLVRPQKFKNPAEDYPKEFRQMKLAAAITYSLFDMERQAVDWLREISDQPLAQILLLYYKMKEPSNQTAKAIQILSNLMAPFETDHTLDYNARMILSYGQFRLGQCFELGHSVSVDEAAAAEYYNKACAFLKSNEMYEKLAEISEKNGSHNATDLFPTLYNAAHNNKDATFKLAQYYESQATNNSLEKAISHYRKAADLGHAEACYRYAKYRIKKTMETTIRQEGTAASSKIAADYLRLAASKNHDSAFYELGMLELKAGMYEEAIDDLKEADFLNCSEASYQLGELYSTGFIGTIQSQVTFKINQNYETAYDYFMHAYQNNPMHLLTIIKLGSFYEQGLYKKQDLAKAKQWYMKALSLRKDDGIAEYALGCLEETNIELSGLAPTNALRKTAYEWFTKSYALGNRDAKFKIGVYLLHGWVDPHGTETEKRGLEILIEENNDSELKAMIVLAKYFEKKGEYQIAFDYWRNAEMLEDPEALEYIGKCYEEGLLGQEINLEEATSYKQRAIEARKHAKETQCSVMGFKSDYSDERN
ncbi:hypothetical protein RO3G_00450 [Rhizopus delemar RA 99-880]|uniref:Uncharacterized protein n=1 Tax=Rhizopus delemar (strain RA 99-880 / ATCC MYA-4621 / FGSC 9543 / NRRL 43880) TaxID=246409 RepID=I1BHR6_RHIO9|nr:hypothetical protein RO3G_00450 [Rhizopus delemar RA 99-880]|eukprot:EIE75746.1 hypothetical protein RO3G_00450 [Rhizopus delemar RA 99-880]